MNAFYPILLCGCQIKRDKTTFFLPFREVDVTMPAKLAKQIIKLDGTKSVETIINRLSTQWDKHALQELFTILIDSDIVQNSRNLSEFLLQFGKNPNPWCDHVTDQQALSFAQDTALQQSPTIPDFTFSLEATAWMKQLRQRKSVRNFSGTAVAGTTVQRLLWACYGVTRQENGLSSRTVPSAGGLFPLIIHLTLFKGTDELPCGTYRVTSNKVNTVSLHLINNDTAAVLSAFLQQREVSRSSGVITISGCFARSASKYANRGVAYTMIEAGHAAQNVHLAAIEEEIATLEVGGFLETFLHKALDLDQQWFPLITVAFGHESKGTKTEPTSRDDAITHIIDRIEVAPATVSEYMTPFQMVFGEFKPNNSQDVWHSCGRSPDLDLARIKATAEAIEWFACTRAHAHHLIDARYCDICTEAIHPETLARYTPNQLSGARGIIPFDPEEKYQWLPVIDALSGSEKLILADFVYFPYTPPHGKRFAFANSSGTAAHTTPERAFESALLELAEREAYMITWFNRLQHPRVLLKSLPEMMQNRIREIEKHGFQVTITDMSMGLTPVAHVCITSQTRNPFFCSSAASDYDFVLALDRALMESEASVYCRLRDATSTSKIISVERVENTDDHAALYQSKKYQAFARFLLGANTVRSLQEIQRMDRPRTHEALLTKLNELGMRAYVGDLSKRDPLVALTEFHVVKAIVPGMIPMTFGYNVEPILLDRIRRVPVECKLRMRSTSFRRLNRLPHPYN